MSTSIAHGLPGPKTNCNYFTRQFQCLFQKGDGLIFLKYFLWCWSGDATKLGYCGWGSHRRSLLLLNVLWSSNKFALRPDYSTSTPLRFSQCSVFFFPRENEKCPWNTFLAILATFFTGTFLFSRPQFCDFLTFFTPTFFFTGTFFQIFHGFTISFHG